MALAALKEVNKIFLYNNAKWFVSDLQMCNYAVQSVSINLNLFHISKSRTRRNSKFLPDDHVN